MQERSGSISLFISLQRVGGRGGEAGGDGSVVQAEMEAQKTIHGGAERGHAPSINQSPHVSLSAVGVGRAAVEYVVSNGFFVPQNSNEWPLRYGTEG